MLGRVVERHGAFLLGAGEERESSTALRELETRDRSVVDSPVTGSTDRYHYVIQSRFKFARVVMDREIGVSRHADLSR